MKNLNAIIAQCPKVYKEIKKFYLEKDPSMKGFLTDEVLGMIISKSPYSILEYFDTIDMICNLQYGYSEGLFTVNVNGETVEYKKDFLQSKNRQEALNLAVEYLLVTTEKTL